MKLRLVLRIVLLFVLFAAVLLASVGVFSYRSGSENLRAAVISEMQSIGIEKEAALDTWIAERLGEIGQMAVQPDVVQKAADLIAAVPASQEFRSAHATLLKELQPFVDRRHSPFIEAFVMEPDGGRVVASTRPNEEGKSKTGHPYFDNGKIGLYLQSPYQSVDLGAPAFTVAAPLRATDGRLVAVLAFRLDFAVLAGIVQRWAGLHKTDDAFLLNAERFFVTQPRFISEPVVLRRKLNTEAARQLVKGQSGVMEARDYRGVPVIAAYRWIFAYRIGLIVKVDQSEALAPVYAFRRSVLLISILALFAAAGLAWLLAQTVTRPLRALRAGVQSFAEGTMADPLPHSSEDEVGLLTREFNAMAARVAERNAKLAQANGALQSEIAERTHVEAALLQKERFLSESQRLGRIGSWLFDGRGSIAWSDEMCRLFGVSPDTFVPTPESALSLMDPGDRPAMKAWMTACAAGEKPGELEFRVNRPDGTIRVLTGRGEAVHAADSTGSLIHIAGTVQDITDRKRTEAELQRFREELERRVADATTANASLQRQAEELTRLNGERAALGDMNDLLPACATADEAYEIFRGAAGGLFPSLNGALHIFAASRNQLTPAATWGEWPEAAVPANPEDCWGLRRGKCYVGNGTATPPCGHAGPTRGLSTLCVPLTAYGEVLGVLHLRGPQASAVQSVLQLAAIVGDGLALTLANLRLRASLQAQSIRDPLTDLYNRRYMTETLEREFARAKRTGASVAVFMIDADHFKRFNDTFGHAAGDAVLRELGMIFRRSIRAEDIACRYGGEEFCLVLPQMDREGARQRAEVIRAEAEGLEVRLDGRALEPVTLSIGVALYPEDAGTIASVIAVADASLYHAKREGRNRVVMSRPADIRVSLDGPASESTPRAEPSVRPS